MTQKIAALVGVVATLLAMPAVAHHSFAMFDHDEYVTLNATVTEFEWINPHAWVHVELSDESGKAITWSFEAGSPGQLTAKGWNRQSLRVGDKVAIEFHPLKDGSYGGQILSVVLPSGETLSQGGGGRG